MAASGDPSPKTGIVEVVSYSTAFQGNFVNSIGTAFYDGPGYAHPPGCKQEPMGACSMQTCVSADVSAQTRVGANMSAGNIAIGGTQPSFTLEYDPNSERYDAVPNPPSDRLIYDAGAVITFTAEGAEVPAFSTSFAAPTPVVFTSPALTGSAFSIDTGADLVLKWTGSPVGLLVVTVDTSTWVAPNTASSSLVECRFEACAGAGTIPSAALQRLPKTDETTTASLAGHLSTTKNVRAGDFTVELGIVSAATKPDGYSPFAKENVTLF